MILMNTVFLLIRLSMNAYTYVLDYYSGLINLDYPHASFINRSNGVRFDCYYNSDIFKFSFVIIFSG